LKSMTRGFRAHIAARDAMKFLINDARQLFECAHVAFTPGTKQRAYFVRGDFPGLFSRLHRYGLNYTLHDPREVRFALITGGRLTETRSAGLVRPNTGSFGVNEKGQVLVQAETSATDPNHENFRAYATGFRCVLAVWEDGVLTQLPTLGGTNAGAGTINNRGE